MQVSFYHVINPELEKCVCKLIEKIYNSGLSIIIFSSNPSNLESLNKTLWTFASKSFIPHGTFEDPLPEKQPILLSTELEKSLKIKPQANILISYNSILPTYNNIPERLIYIFHDLEEESVENARKEYKRLKDLGTQLIYYKQQEDGSWAKF